MCSDMCLRDRIIIVVVLAGTVYTVMSVFAATAPPAFVFNLNVFGIISPYPNASASAAASSGVA